MELTSPNDLQGAWTHLNNTLHHPKCTGLAAWQRIYVRRCRAARRSADAWCPHLDLSAEKQTELRALIVRARILGKWDTEYPLPDFEM